MPWWAIAYLFFLVSIVFISIVKDIIDHHSIAYVVAEFASGLISASFIIASWSNELANILSWLVIPLLIYAVAWDQFALKNMKKNDFKDLTLKENKDMHQYSKLLAILFMLPCYIAGLVLNYQLF